MKVVNRRARYDYSLLEKFEVGIALTGPEVKSVKASKLSLNEGFVKMIGGEAWLLNAYINPYPYADNRDYDPKRNRKLLLHKNELLKLSQQTKEKNLTIVPVSCYTKGRKIKLEIALARGKKKYDKREVKKRQAIEREIEQTLKDKGM
ncbi:SsrA-binding protein [Microgenomates group bacterium RBG_19FT_COMBO_39_10]|nr:MAG: SsrA-binding protein [Microgenomates group bacterium RBG_19FT_COMBO_39_10]